MTHKFIQTLSWLHPIERWNGLSVVARFTLLLTLLVIIALVPVYYLICQALIPIRRAELEQAGLKPIQMQLAIIQRTQQHRGLAMRYLLDETMTRKEIRAKGEEVEEAIVTFETKSKSFRSPALRGYIDKQTELWHGVSQDVGGKTINHEQSFARHTELIAEEFKALSFILDDYGLVLDGETDGHYLITAALSDLPRLTELLGQLRALGVASLAKGSATFQERAHIKALLMMAQHQMIALDNSVRRALDVNKSRDIEIQNYKNAVEQYKKVIALTQEQILNREYFEYSAMGFYTDFTLAINTCYGFTQISGNQIFDVLQQRINHERNRLYKRIAFIVALLVLSAVILSLFVRRQLLSQGAVTQAE